MAEKAKKPKTMQQLETEYIKSQISYRALAEKYGVPKSNIDYYAKRNNWVKKRRQYRDKVKAKTLEKSAESEAKKLTKIGGIAEKMVETLEAAVEDSNQFYRVISKTKDGQIIEKETKVFSAAAFRQVTAALKELADVIRDVYEIPRAEKNETAEIRLVLPEGCEGFDA